MKYKRLAIMKKVSQAYYLEKKSQVEIARMLNLSRSKVSRLLNEANENGYIHYRLEFPTLRDEYLSRRLEVDYGLKYAYVTNESMSHRDDAVRDCALGLTDYLKKVVSDNEIIGLAWGKTMYAISREVDTLNKSGLEVVQLHGGVSNTNTDTLAADIIRNFGNRWNAKWYTLPIPSIVDTSFIAKTLMQDSKISYVFQLIDAVNTAIFSVGTMRSSEMGVKTGYFTKEEFFELENDGYVGDICSRYYKQNGDHLEGELYERVLGISLEQLKQKRNKICVALNVAKARSIKAAIQSDCINALFTDQQTALELLK